MAEKRFEIHHETIKEMLEKLGKDETDNYLLEELTYILRSIAAQREKIADIDNALMNTTNTDQKVHLEYDRKDAECVLNSLIKKLEFADDRYTFFKSLLRTYEENIW